MARKNWIEIYNFFLNNQGVSYADVAKTFGVPIGSIKYQAAKSHWQEKRQEIVDNAIKQLEEKTTITIAESKRQQAEVGKALQIEAAKALVTKNVTPKTPSEIAQWIRTGIKIERDAFGMNKHNQHKPELTDNMMQDKNTDR